MQTDQGLAQGAQVEVYDQVLTYMVHIIETTSILVFDSYQVCA